MKDKGHTFILVRFFLDEVLLKHFNGLKFSHNDMRENFILIQLTLAEIFVPQDFIIRTTPGLSGPANTCAVGLFGFGPIFGLFHYPKLPSYKRVRSCRLAGPCPQAKGSS